MSTAHKLLLNGLGTASTFPRRGSDGSLPALDIDFVRQLYWVNGVYRQWPAYFSILAGAPSIDIAGLIANAGDRAALPDQAWFNRSGGTVLVEWKDLGVANDGNRTAFSVGAGSGGTQERLEIGSVYNGTITTRVASLYMGNTAGATITSQSGGAIHNGFYKLGVNFTAGGPISWADNGILTTGLSFSGSWATAMDKNGLAFRANGPDGYLNAASTSARLQRVTAFATAQSDAFITAQTLVSSKSNLNFLGDSFVQPGAGLRYATNAAVQDTFRVLSFDGVAGSTLSAQATRWAATPTFWDRALIIVDGSGPDEDMTTVYLPKLAEIVGRLTSGKWIYVQGGINRLSTPSEVTATLALYAQVQAAYPNNYLPTYDYMRANGTGSTTGANGGAVWAADNYFDDLHPSVPMGTTNLANCIAAEIAARVW